jgi:hypothetical protein
MLHSACAMVRSLRDAPADSALLYGQGGYVTKHHALVIGCRAAEPAWLMLNRDVQDMCENARGDVPRFDGSYAGPARVETFSIVFGRDGQPSHGSVVGRTPDQARVFGKLDMADNVGLAAFLSVDASPVGMAGRVDAGDDGLQHWRVT